MNMLRAQILACFVVPEPTHEGDLLDRAVQSETVAWYVLDVTARPLRELSSAEIEALSDTKAKVTSEAEAMVADRLLDRPDPQLERHHAPPSGAYILTRAGALLAMAVLARSKEGAAHA